MSKLVFQLIKNGYLRSDLIIDAFWEISREEFLPEELAREAEANIALPIGHGQTISQPLTVALMLELLDPRRGHNILDIGSGSGWTTALLSYIVGKNGRVTAIEREGELKKIGERNVAKYGYLKDKKHGIAEFHVADGTKGFSKNAPYDRILVSASAESVPKALKEQLKVGGKMIIPLRHSIWYLEKKSENDFSKEEYPGFDFVPLIEN
ncbi:MAG TPA: protein-L-isoaspartate O-methyltransferase [Patescibacteria group bacterium]|nr:protein-L-isoaspartate O-methyltransferase [Patescibacteria group bacterium]